MTSHNELVLQVRVIITAGLKPPLVAPLVKRERKRVREREEAAVSVSLVLLSNEE